MLRKLGVITAAVVAAATLFGPAGAQAVAASRTATVTDIVPFFYGYFLHVGTAVGEQLSANSGSINITATCEIHLLSATTPHTVTSTECSIRDTTTGEKHYLFSTGAGLVRAGGAGTFVLPASHKYALCVQGRHDSNIGTLITPEPCAALK